MNKAYRSSVLAIGSLVLMLLPAARGVEVESLLGCWAGPYTRNEFRIEKSDRVLYASVRGSTLTRGEEADFALPNAEEPLLVASRFGFLLSNRTYGISAAFDLASCKIDVENRTFDCASGVLAHPERREKIYLSRVFDDLGQPKEIVSISTTQRLELEASPQGLTLIQRLRSRSGEDSEDRIEIGGQGGAVQCQSESERALVKVSRRVIEFVEMEK